MCPAGWFHTPAPARVTSHPPAHIRTPSAQRTPEHMLRIGYEVQRATPGAAWPYVTNTLLDRVVHGHGGGELPSILLREVKMADAAIPYLSIYTSRFMESSPARFIRTTTNSVPLFFFFFSPLKQSRLSRPYGQLDLVCCYFCAYCVYVQSMRHNIPDRVLGSSTVGFG